MLTVVSMFAGGTFALYSLLCRYCNICALPNQHPTDVELTTYLVDHAHQKTFLQRKLEGSHILQKVLLIIVLFGTCMVIGDGILTPAISGKHHFHLAFIIDLFKVTSQMKLDT